MRTTKAELLPEGWNWEHYEDRSGCLRSPEGKAYFSYDLTTGEYIREIGGNYRWYPDGLDMQEFRQESEELMREKLGLPMRTQENTRSRLFVDMDGTLAEFKNVDTLEQLYEEGYFLKLQPQEKVVEAVRIIAQECPDIEVFILSAVLSDSPYALQEKNMWLDIYLPEIDARHRLFPPCGTDKKEAVEGAVTETDFLLDDYTKNLNDWEPPARGIKLLNGINHTRGSWQSAMVEGSRQPVELAGELATMIRGTDSTRERGQSGFTGQEKGKLSEQEIRRPGRAR